MLSFQSIRSFNSPIGQTLIPKKTSLLPSNTSSILTSSNNHLLPNRRQFLQGARSFSYSTRLLSTNEDPEPELVFDDDIPSENQPDDVIGVDLGDGQVLDIDKIIDSSAVAGQASSEFWPYSPVSLLCETLSWFHQGLEMPWWIAIIFTTVLLRTAALPLSVRAARVSATMAQIGNERQQKIRGLRDPVARAAEQKKLMAEYKEHGVHPVKAVIPALIQLPFFVTFFMGLRRMTDSFPSMQEGGILWFTDLTVPDPDGLARLPLISALIMLINFESSFARSAAATPGWLKNVFRGISCFTLLVTLHFAQAIHLYWAVSGLYTLGQSAAIHNPKVRDFLNIPQAPKSTAPAPSQSTVVTKSDVSLTKPKRKNVSPKRKKK